MSEILLDPREVERLEPSVRRSAYSSISLSPFSVPTAVEVVGNPIVGIQFRYHGGETCSDSVPLDSELAPAVSVELGKHSGKVVSLRFDPSIRFEDLRDIAKRIHLAADRELPLRQALSYRMTSRIICDVLLQTGEVHS